MVRQIVRRSTLEPQNLSQITLLMPLMKEMDGLEGGLDGNFVRIADSLDYVQTEATAYVADEWNSDMKS